MNPATRQNINSFRRPITNHNASLLENHRKFHHISVDCAKRGFRNCISIIFFRHCPLKFASYNKLCFVCLVVSSLSSKIILFEI